MLCMHVNVYLDVHLYVFICLSVYVCWFVYLSVCLSVCLAVCLIMNVYAFQLAHMHFLCLSVCVHAFFSLCVLICMCVFICACVCVLVSGCAPMRHVCVCLSVYVCACAHIQYIFMHDLKMWVHFVSQTKVLCTRHFSTKENLFITQSLQLLEPAHYHHRRYIKYCDGFAQSIARQQLSKHVATHAPRNNMVEVFLCAPHRTTIWQKCLLGGPTHETVWVLVFIVVHAVSIQQEL
jgi:hypothetical protein